MKQAIITAPMLALTLGLAACNDEPQTTASAEQGGEAAGEVLGGTISDDMIPLEQLRSQSPPAERIANGEDGATDGEAGEEGAQVDGDSAQSAPPAQPTTAPLPTAPPISDQNSDDE